MQISSRFTIAIHVFACMEVFGEDYKITSDFLASSINVNPVIIRKILSQLRNAGLIEVARGTGGTTATRPIDEITFYDVYLAVDLLEEGELFHFHENPNPNCPVGKNIHTALDDRLLHIQGAMEQEMKKYTIADVVNDIKKCLTVPK
ncbi:MAG: Rrf2 family transcriptional regulator [Lachnospiraceae bacterium]|nr:Rrf2 family transcriptional regulator [Lachnospiraceae bacterium]